MARERFEGTLGGIYSRNETFLALSAMIFICSVFIGYAFAGMLEPIMASLFGEFKRRIVEGELKLDTVSIFLNNLKVALVLYTGGIIFGLATAYFLIYNGIFLGYAGSNYQIGDFIIATIPHGVFEIFGIIIAGAAGFSLAKIVIDILKGTLKIQSDFSVANQLKFLLEANYDDFKDTLIMLGIAIVLLFIAAIIEANFTPGWIQYMHGVA